MEARGLSGLALLLALALALARATVFGLVPHLAAGPAGPQLPFLTLFVGVVGGLVRVVRAVVAVVAERVALSTQSSLPVTQNRGNLKQVR